ncbi:MAG: collagen-like triple helix repeat-containing protein [Nocardioides sp.]
MGKWASLGLTALIAVVFGFLGSFVAVNVSSEQLRGAQGATGLQGAPGPQGPAGIDGADGVDGARGPAGRAGKAGHAAAKAATDLGTVGCVGRSVEVVTDVTVKNQKISLTKKTVCVVR